MIVAETYSLEPILDPAKRWAYLKIDEGMESGELAVVEKKGFLLTTEIPHQCNCEHCDKVEKFKYFSEKRKDVVKQQNHMSKKYGEDNILESRVDEGVWHVKIVVQNKDAGPLFGHLAEDRSSC